MKKKLLSLLLALTLCLGLLPVSVSAAGTNPPDWYFLFAIFKNVDADAIDKDGKQQHAKYTMPQEEIDAIHDHAEAFEEYMNQLGLMRAHVNVVDIDAPITQLEDYEGGSWFSPEEADVFLKDNVDLDQYDHVFGIISMDVSTSYAGLTGAALENGTGYSCIHYRDSENCLKNYPNDNVSWLPTLYVHEFIHFTEQLSQRLGADFDLHETQDIYDSRLIDGWKACYTDTLLNRVQGNAETGTGVGPNVWQYSPRVYRSTSEWTIPSSVTAIGAYAFQNFSTLTKVTIPGNIGEITKYAFFNCNNLKEVTLFFGIISIGEWAFGCEEPSSLTTVSIPASVTSIGYAAFWNTGIKDVYYAGTEAQWKAIKIGEYNNALTGATIHYNSPASNSPATPAVTVENIPASGTAVASTQTVSVDGKSVEFQMYALVDANGNATNYIKLRDMAYVLNNTTARFSVGYDSASNQISLATGQAYAASGSEMTTPFSGNRNYTGGAQTVKINGQPVDMTAITLQDDSGGGYNYFKLRDLGAALGFNVGYSNEQGVYIESGKPYQG